MSYTYSGNPNASLVDETHYLLGNTNPENPMATDEECAYALARHRNNTYLAAASIAETKAYELMSRPIRVQRGPRTTVYTDPAQAFLMLARQLRTNASLKTTTLYAGGVSVTEKASDRAETELVQPFARKHLHSGPRPYGVEDLERET